MYDKLDTCYVNYTSSKSWAITFVCYSIL